MRIRHLRADGLRSHPSLDEPADGEVVLLDSPARLRACADAAAMWATTLAPRAALTATLDVGGEVEPNSGLPAALHGLRPSQMELMLAPREPRVVRIDVTIQPDPPLYGILRKHAARDARLITALGEGSDLRVHVAWLVDRAGGSAGLSVLSFAVGAASFPVADRERPVWLAALLGLVGRRVDVFAPRSPAQLALDLLHASTSPDPERRRGWSALRAALVGEPFRLPTAEIVLHDDAPYIALGPDLVPLRSFGPGAELAVDLVAKALIDAPDVLFVPTPLPSDHPALRWLVSQTRGDAATLEQVWLADGMR